MCVQFPRPGSSLGPSMRRKPANCYIIAGPNGAGKTTFATEYLPHYANCINFINPDLLARAYSPFDPDAGMKKRTRSSMTVEATQALREAVAKVVEEHRRRGIPLAVWRDGRAVSIPASEAAMLRETPVSYRPKSAASES
jgi:hypothetical protein